jgi:hypothetical protein
MMTRAAWTAFLISIFVFFSHVAPDSAKAVDMQLTSESHVANDDSRQLVGGTFFVFGLGIILAVLCIRRE